VQFSLNQTKMLDKFKQKSAGKVVLYVIIEDEVSPIVMSLADEIRLEVLLFVESIVNTLKIKIKMLTGDQKDVAEAVCKDLNIDCKSNCHSSLLPLDKYTIVSSLEKDKKEKVMMIGDGV